jgi:hypothetical protein
MAEKDGSSRSNIDTRLRWKFSANLDKRIKAVWQVEVGDVMWGDGNSADIGTDGTNVETKHAYLEYVCPKSGMKTRVGLQAWADHRSLVFDDDFAAIGMMHNLNGMDLAFYFAKVAEGNLAKDDDYDLFIITAKNKMLGADFIAGRSMAGKKMEYWFMPYATMKMDAITFDGMLGLNFGTHEEGSLDGLGEDLTNFGYAAALKAEYDMGTKLKADLLFTSGDDGKDPESTSSFNTISAYYMNGLEILGWGIHDGWAIAPGADKAPLGTLTFALSANHPISDELRVFGAFGMANYIEDNAAGETNLGMEFNAGVCKKIYKPLSLKAIFAYMMAGDALVDPNAGDTADDIMKVATVLEYKF